MPIETKKPGSWSTVRQHLATWEKPALLVLVKDLYAAAEVSRDLVDGRCQPGASSGATLEKYRGKIVEQFFPARGEGKLKLGEARKAIRDYRKATGNVSGAVELLMTYVEKMTEGIGWGFHDFVADVIGRLQEELGPLLRIPKRNRP